VLSLYDQLMELKPSPVVALNRSVAIARIHGAQAALAELDRLDGEPALRAYYLLPAVRGQLLAELNRHDAAIAAYRQALALSPNAPERRFLQQRIDRLEQRGLGSSGEELKKHRAGGGGGRAGL